jgi:putative SOS response-associated peptidase YedK
MMALSFALILPACGKNEVKSQKASETNLKSATSAATMTVTASVSATQTASATATAVVPMTNSYTKHKTSANRGSASGSSSRSFAMKKPAVPMMAAPMTTAVPTMQGTPMATFTPVTAQAQKKPGSHWPLIVAGVALVAAVGFYFWTKKEPPQNDFPLPPMGGLSPVSGFTAMRNKVNADIKKTSIWTKKIF